MSNRIRYAYLKGQTWLYRRNYPADVALILGISSLKQSLKTSDAKVARSRCSEVNRTYEARLESARAGLEALSGTFSWEEPSITYGPLWEPLGLLAFHAGRVSLLRLSLS